MDQRKHSGAYALLLIVASSLAFTIMVLLIRLAGKIENLGFGALEAVLARSAPMALFCLVWMIRDTAFKPALLTHKERIWLFVRGLIGAASMTCLFYAGLHMPLAMASLLANTSVFFMAVLAHIFLGERLNRTGLVMVLGGFAGVAVILWDDLGWHQRQNTHENWLAYAIALMSGLLSAIAYFSVRKLKEVRPSATIFALAICGILLPLASPFFGNSLHFPKTTSGWALLLSSSIPAIVGQLCLTEGLRKGSSTLVSTGQYMGPVFATLLGIWFFGEHLTLQKTLGGAAVICFGIAFPVVKHFAKKLAAPRGHAMPPEE